MPDLSKMSNTTYDRLKRAAELLLPALGALYFTLAQIWNFPYGEQVVGSIAAVNTFVGVIVVVARSQYQSSESMYDGDLVLEEVDGVLKYSMVLDHAPEDLIGQDEFRLKVKKN